MPLTLLYHAILSNAPGSDRALIVEPDELDWQFGELRRCGFRSLKLDEYHAALKDRDDDPAAILLTFDDAYAHLFPRVSALLEKHDLTAAVFAPMGHLGGRNDWDGTEIPLHGHGIATAATLQEAAQGPWELGSHGLAHVDLTTLSQAERLRQLIAARDRLSELTGCDVVDLAYPYGASDQAVRDDARRAGYRMAFSAHAVGTDDRFALARVPIRGQDGRTAFRVRIEPGFRRVYG